MILEVKTQPKNSKPNPFINLCFNVVLPTICLIKLTSWTGIEPVKVLIIALSFPLIYGLHEYLKSKKIEFLSVIGIVGVLLLGGISLLQLPPHYIAIKEAAIPALIGIFCLVSLKTRYPFIKKLVYSDLIFKIDVIEQHIAAQGNQVAFDKLLTRTTWILSLSFFLSAILNYVLAKMVVTVDATDPLYNEQLGTMIALSFPVIAVPVTCITVGLMIYFFRSLTKLTNCKIEQLLKHSN